VVVGSALVNRIAELEDRTDHDLASLQAQTSLIADMRRALDARCSNL